MRATFRTHSLSARNAVEKSFLPCVVFLCLAAMAVAAEPGLRFSGRVMYRGTKVSAPGVLVEIVEAEDNGEPSDEVLGTTRADAAGSFTVILTKPTKHPVTLLVSAVRTSAETDGDRREEGYEVKKHRTQLGFLPYPSTAKSNIIQIERRQPKHSSGRDE